MVSTHTYNSTRLTTYRAANIDDIDEIDDVQWIQPWMTSIITHPSLQGSMSLARPWSPYFCGNGFPIFDPIDEISFYNESLSNERCFFQQNTLSLSIHIHITSYCSSSSSSDDVYSSFPSTDFEPYRPCWTKLAPANVSITISLGKPLFPQILEREMAQQVGAMAVCVCGPGSMGDDVRHAVRKVQGKKTVDFFEEAFSW